jgi:maltooligosyltrehalose trehalohydrolase
VSWRPSLGAQAVSGGAQFRVWAAEAKQLAVALESGVQAGRTFPLTKDARGYFAAFVPEVRHGDLYRFTVDGQGPFPDPASRFQPHGVHGPSQVIDPFLYAWNDAAFRPVPQSRLVLYELHVGTFTPEGTFQALIGKLPYLRDLGITAIELMPVGDFAGDWNWGYDGVALFAPARCYGAPDDLRQLVDRAHALGLAVHLDVVYNHLGPDGAYHKLYCPYYYSDRHRSPWGEGINFDGPHSESVRAFFIENALRWIFEYHIDGLRLDATHAIVDDSATYFLEELCASIRNACSAAGRRVTVIAEDTRNLRHMLEPPSNGGWGLDGVWSDDFHHQVRRCLAGDSDGYFADYDGAASSIAATARQGWFYTGQYAKYFGHHRGTDPAGLPPDRFVFFIQNHDQTGNRAFGERLHHQISPAAWRAASVLLLALPEVPLLFMGQEWAASTPFLYFTNHNPELGRAVTEGRRREFGKFAAFANPAAREKIPDPQAPETFARSKLRWEELSEPPCAASLRLYRKLLHLRGTEPALRWEDGSSFEVRHLDESTVLIVRRRPGVPSVHVLVRLRHAGPATMPEPLTGEIALTTEDEDFCDDPRPMGIDWDNYVVRFQREGAIVFRVPEPGR